MHLDTHVVVWLYSGDLSRFPQKALDAIEEEDLFISPAVILELQYLNEIKRITVSAPLIIETLSASIGLEVAQASFHEVVMESLSANWTRDPFDRIIASQSICESQPLLTKDSVILSHCPLAIWD